jgi:hypothetical protein
MKNELNKLLHDKPFNEILILDEMNYLNDQLKWPRSTKVASVHMFICCSPGTLFMIPRLLARAERSGKQLGKAMLHSKQDLQDRHWQVTAAEQLEHPVDA